jgi:hypothetical protein
MRAGEATLATSHSCVSSGCIALIDVRTELRLRSTDQKAMVEKSATDPRGIRRSSRSE